MPPKRKNDVAEEAVSSNKKKATAGVDPAAQPRAAAKPKFGKALTLKEKILAVLSKEEGMVGLASIKKQLLEQYDFPTDGVDKANSNKLNKTLKAMVDEERDDFGKIGGSYHGGIHSAAYIAYSAAEAAKKAAQDEWDAHKDELQCPYCGTWDNEMAVWKGEDSIARGSKFQCSGCKKTYWTWISDFTTNKLGHRQEYKFSGMYDRN